MSDITLEGILRRPLGSRIEETLRVQICSTVVVNDNTMKLAPITSTQSLRAVLTGHANMLFSQLKDAVSQKATLKIRNSKYDEDNWLKLDGETMVTILPRNNFARIAPERCTEAAMSPDILQSKVFSQLKT